MIVRNMSESQGLVYGFSIANKVIYCVAGGGSRSAQDKGTLRSHSSISVRTPAVKATSDVHSTLSRLSAQPTPGKLSSIVMRYSVGVAER